MTRYLIDFIVLRIGLACTFLLAACSSAPGSTVSTEDTQVASAVDAWPTMCLITDRPPSPGDSANAALMAAARLWDAERGAFREYQSTFCRDCAMFERSAPKFFASSSYLVAQIAQRFPQSPAAACAAGLAYVRNASLGEGEFDNSMLRMGMAEFERGLTLELDSTLSARLSAELANAQELYRPR